MGKQYEKKITWEIKNFTTLQSQRTCSDQFVVGGCRWFLSVYPKGHIVDNYLSLFLEVAGYESLPPAWRRHARYLLTIVNHNSEKRSQLRELQHWFDEKSNSWGFASMLPLNKIKAKDSGFLLNGELKIVVEIDMLKVIGKLDVTEETSIMVETMDVNGFQLLPSQVKSVSRLLERHPEIASEVRSKNPNFRTGYMSLLLGLIETICQSPQELSMDDLCEAYAALGFMTDAGFRLDWLENKLDEVSRKKENEEASEARLQEMEEELKDMKLKCLHMEALVEKEKGTVLDAKASLSFDDVV